MTIWPEGIFGFPEQDDVALGELTIFVDSEGDRGTNFEEAVHCHATEHLDAERLGCCLVLCGDELLQVDVFGKVHP